MNSLYARSVFFVKDTERALRFYTETLGFAVDWKHLEEGRIAVCQVSLSGFELILDQVDDSTANRAGHGRLFIGLDDDQGESFRKHVLAAGIQTQRLQWGRPTLVIRDADDNELFFWLSRDDFAGLTAAELSP